MIDNSTVGVVILNYNDSETTLSLCNTIKNYEDIDKILIVDNLSTDNSFENLIKIKSDKVLVTRTKTNGGYSYGNNYGARLLINQHRIDYLVFANPDVKFSGSHIRNLVGYLRKNDLHATAGIMKDSNGEIFRWNGKIYSYAEAILDNTLFLRRFLNFYDLKYASEDENFIYTDSLPGSLFVINANVFEKIGGFDEEVFLYFEEAIIAKRLTKCGFKFALLKHESFIHDHSVSINKSLAKINQIRQYYISKEYFYFNYFNLSKAKKICLKIANFYGFFVRKIIYNLLFR